MLSLEDIYNFVGEYFGKNNFKISFFGTLFVNLTSYIFSTLIYFSATLFVGKHDWEVW